MKDVKITTVIKECSFEELTDADRELVEAAKAMTRTSYVPYSRFHVGAAIRLADGSIVRGSNQENAAYPSGMCAERTACYQAGALHPGVPFEKIAVAAWSDTGKAPGLRREEYFQKEPISPCGACRQALLEYEKLAEKPVEVILYGRDKIFIFPSVASLLPFSFTEF